MSGGLLMMIVHHDDDCPILLPTPGTCRCNPTTEIVDEATFATTVAADARKRTAVAGAVAELLRKMQRDGGRP